MVEKNEDSEKEPPSLIVGRDCENHWVVVEVHGRCGGIFANEAAAMHYARDEARGYPGAAVRVANDVVALNLDGPPPSRRRALRRF
jgi:hypothetical protein